MWTNLYLLSPRCKEIRSLRKKEDVIFIFRVDSSKKNSCVTLDTNPVAFSILSSEAAGQAGVQTRIVHL